MSTLFSYPGTTPAHAEPKTRQIKVIADNVQILLEEGSRTFQTGRIVALSDFEFSNLSATSFGTLVEDQGAYAPVGDDLETSEVVFNLTLAEIADGVLNTYNPAFAGSIVSWYITITDPVTTADKTTTLTLQIDGTAVTGASQVLASAAATPEGALIEAGAISGANTFAVGEDITLTAAATTAFVEGAATVTLILVAA